jgi:hypothetical protein
MILKTQKFVLFILLLVGTYAFGQSSSGNTEVDALIAQLKNPAGKITFTINGKTYNDKASLINTKKNIAIGTSLMSAVGENQIHLVIGSTVTGEQGTLTSASGKEHDSVMVIDGKAYQLSGTVNIKNTGGKVSGTFKCQMFALSPKKARASTESSGTVTGTFSGLTDSK